MAAKPAAPCRSPRLDSAIVSPSRYRSWSLFRRVRLCPLPIAGRRMRRLEARASRAVKLFTQRAGPIGLLVAAAPRQLRHQHIGNILEITRRDRKGDVQPVDSGPLDPGLDVVGDLFRRADHDRSDAADADM